MQSFKFSFIYAISVIMALSCSQPTMDDAVHITIEYPSKMLFEVAVTFQKMLNLNQNVLAEGSIDSSGRCRLEFKIDRERFALLRIGHHESLLYLKPGYKLHISADVNDKLIVSGIGAEANNYLLNIM